MAAKKHYKDYVKDEHFELIPKWKRQGQKDDWIAKKLGIGITKLKDWKNEYPSFKALFKNGTADLLLELEETLYTRARGTYVDDSDIVVKKNAKGEIIETIQRKKKKFIWSDSNLQFALRKLDPKKWGDKIEIEGDGDKKEPITIKVIR